MTALDAAGVAASLSEPMRRALARAQEDLFVDRAVVTGHGMTIKALGRRRIVTRERPALLTAFGRAVIAIGRCGSGAELSGGRAPAEAGKTLPQAADRNLEQGDPRRGGEVVRRPNQSASAPTSANP